MFQAASQLFIDLRIHEKKILISSFIFLLIMHLLSVYMINIDGPLKYLFFFDHEFNVPTYVTTLLWFCMAYRLWVNHKDKLLSGIALFLGIDESTLIHDRTTDIIRDGFQSTEHPFFETLALFPFAWVFLGFFVMIPIIYAFWKRSKQISNRYLILGICMFFLGAVGVEIIGSFFVLFQDNAYTPGHINQILYTIIITTEEGLEISGLMVALYGLGSRFTQKIEQQYESSNRTRLFPSIRWSRKGS